MFPNLMVLPMREELTQAGFRELRTPEEVDAVLAASKGTVLVMVNSICGCAAGKARPGVIKAVQHTVRPEVLTTVFAGQDVEATERARSYFPEYSPSSPSVALLRDGKAVFMLERYQIENRGPDEIAAELIKAFDRVCKAADAKAAS
jgi:bacilliredoxin